jgi:hypothetical protein
LTSDDWTEAGPPMIEDRKDKNKALDLLTSSEGMPLEAPTGLRQAESTKAPETEEFVEDLPEGDTSDLLPKPAEKTLKSEATGTLDSGTAEQLAVEALQHEWTSEQLRASLELARRGLTAEEASKKVTSNPRYKVPTRSEMEVRRDRIIAILRRSLDDVDSEILDLLEGEERGAWTSEVRYRLHQVLDVALRVRKRFKAA